MKRVALIAAGAVVAALVLFSSAWAQQAQTHSTTMRWADGGQTTVYGPVSRSRDGGIHLFR